MNDDLTKQVKALALETGYVDCGVTTAEPFDDYAQTVRGVMQRFPSTRPHMERQLGRADPRGTAAWADAIVVCLRSYGHYRVPDGLAEHIGRNYLADRRHTDCPDCDMPRRFTQGLRDLGLRVKRGGVPDRAAAQRAGVARIGRNGFAYSRQHGSWVNIEAWRVDARLAPDTPSTESPCPDGCRRCRDACPTAAVVEPCGIRMDRCIAWLTYAAPFPVEEALWREMGKWIYGCDVCQNACPLNAGKLTGTREASWIAELADALTPEALAQMDQATYARVVHPLFWYIAEDNLVRWHANARRALECERGHPCD